MKYKYQLIVLGSPTGLLENIKAILNNELESLKLPEGALKLILAEDIEKEYEGNQPAFALYFGNESANTKHEDIVEKLIKDGTMILPICNQHIEKEIPKTLKNQNAIKYYDGAENRIVNTILEAFELLRTTRKIFISYKRTEATSVAIQLHEALESHNFEAFLDTHSIALAEPFQDELWHRMTDCDAIVLLNTKGFLESRWCSEEFAEAGARQIGIVQLIWPDHNIDDIQQSSHISYPVQLTGENFIEGEYQDGDRSKLKPEFIEQILQQVESVRARNLAARQDNLITEFRNMAEKNGRTITIQPERLLTEDLSDKERIIYIPTIGIPQSSSCQTAELKKELYGKEKNVSIKLIYDDLRIRAKWLNHLDWLNDNFKKDIKTLKKQDFQKWLQS